MKLHVTYEVFVIRCLVDAATVRCRHGRGLMGFFDGSDCIYGNTVELSRLL
jgi:hypothetical protein